MTYAVILANKTAGSVHLLPHPSRTSTLLYFLPLLLPPPCVVHFCLSPLSLGSLSLSTQGSGGGAPARCGGVAREVQEAGHGLATGGPGASRGGVKERWPRVTSDPPPPVARAHARCSSWSPSSSSHPHRRSLIPYYPIGGRFDSARLVGDGDGGLPHDLSRLRAPSGGSTRGGASNSPDGGDEVYSEPWKDR